MANHFTIDQNKCNKNAWKIKIKNSLEALIIFKTLKILIIHTYIHTFLLKAWHFVINNEILTFENQQILDIFRMEYLSEKWSDFDKTFTIEFSKMQVKILQFEEEFVFENIPKKSSDYISTELFDQKLKMSKRKGNYFCILFLSNTNLYQKWCFTQIMIFYKQYWLFFLIMALYKQCWIFTQIMTFSEQNWLFVKITKFSNKI